MLYKEEGIRGHWRRRQFAVALSTILHPMVDCAYMHRKGSVERLGGLRSVFRDTPSSLDGSSVNRIYQRQRHSSVVISHRVIGLWNDWAIATPQRSKLSYHVLSPTPIMVVDFADFQRTARQRALSKSYRLSTIDIQQRTGASRLAKSCTVL